MHRWIEWELALHFLQPRRSYLSVITAISMLGVAIGVATLLVVLSVMRGFEKELHEKVLGFQPHIVVTNFGIMEDPEGVKAVVEKVPGVVAVEPFVLGPVIAECGGKVSTPQIQGTEPGALERIVPIKDKLVAGEWLESPDTVLVGGEWARKHNAWVGDTVVVHSPRNVETLRKPPGAEGASYYLPSEYKIAGVFSTGFFEYDFGYLLLTLGEARRLYNVEGRAHGLALRTSDPLKAGVIARELQGRLAGGLEARTWMDQNRPLFSAVQVERRMMTFILFFLLIIAAFVLSGTTLTLVLQKTREIGLLKAVGAGGGQVLAVFTLYGLVIGVMGTALGLAAGILLLSERNNFSAWLARVSGMEIFPAEIYHFTEIPAVWDPATAGAIALAGVVMSTLAASLPAWAASRIQPARALAHG